MNPLDVIRLPLTDYQLLVFAYQCETQVIEKIKAKAKRGEIGS